MHTVTQKVLIALLSLGAVLPFSSSAQVELFYGRTIGLEASGSAGFNCELDQFTVGSTSANISGGGDDFQFIYKELANNLDVKARIASNNASFAGLMIRSGIGSNVAFAAVGSSGGQTITRYRATTNAKTTNGKSMANASWIRIRREGSLISSYYSNDGSSWVLVESRSLQLGSDVAVGMFAVNGRTVFSRVTVQGALGQIDVVDPGSTDPGPIATVPNGPVGLVATVNSSFETELTWSDNSSDENGFYLERSTGGGNYQRIANLGAGTSSYIDGSVSQGSSYTYRVLAYNQTGVSVPSNAQSVSVPVKPSEPEPNDPPPPVDPVPTDPPPTDPDPVDPEPTEPQPPVNPTSPVDEVFSVNEIGNEILEGTASYDESNDVFRLSAEGGKIWGTADDFQYVYRDITGDVEATVKVSSLTAGDDFGKAGIMFRESSGEDTRHAFLAISAGKGVGLERRKEVGGGTIRSGKGNVSTPIWLRLVKEGTYISAFYSEDGDNWSFLSECIIEFPETISIGLAVAAHGENNSVTADFGDLQIVELEAQSANETFISADIGKVGVNGDAAYDPDADSFIVQAAGGDIGAKDAFHYVYREVEGDFEAVVKIDSFVAEERWAKAGLMVRDGVRPDAPYFALFLANEIGVVHQYRTAPGKLIDWSKRDEVYPFLWIKLTRNGNTFAAHYSITGRDWIFMDQANIVLPQVLNIGMSVTSHEEGALAFAEFTDLSINN